MNPKERRNLGAHYTSESNILKLIKPLFLDELWEEFEAVKSNKNKLPEFHKKISQLKFLDPACGCGNFLVITYRELRLLELEVLRATYKSGQGVLDVSDIIWLDVDMMCGIEYEEFPARIAEVAMWLIDHQMNMLISNEFGQYFARLPLKKSAKIVHGDALEVNWETLKVVDEITLKADQLNFKVLNEPIAEYGTVNVITKNVNEIDKTADFPPNITKVKIRYDYIIGNPPFIGSKIMSQFQRNQIIKEFNNSKGCGVLDYVSGWYLKAAKYIQGTTTKAAFVSTNSIVQGEQTSILWGQMINKYGVKIHFAHRTFKWSNEAKGNAAVYCIIVGFANFETKNKVLFEYEDIKGEPQAIQVKNINPYLVDAKDIFIEKRRTPICNVPEISFGSMPNDGGNFLFTDEEKNQFLTIEPRAEQFFKPLISAHEYLNGQTRWCLWLKDANPSILKELKEVSKRIEKVKKIREESTRVATQKLALYPTLFGEDRQPKNDYILIPLHSSENRKYIPMGYFDNNHISNNSCSTVPNTTLYHFGVLQSSLHMSWVNAVCGRLESRYRYSNEIVYNNFPWPDNPSDKQIKTIEEKAQQVLDVRASFSSSSLADLYNPLTMPPALVKAHYELDKAVDVAYSKQAFTSEAKRMEFLFELYEKYTAGLFVKEKKKKS